MSLLTGLALARAKKPDTTLSLTEGTVGVGIGYSWGEGSLSYKGKTFGDLVYDGESKKIEDFDGNYTAAGAGATIGGVLGVTAMKNQNGAIIELKEHDAGSQRRACH